MADGKIVPASAFAFCADAPDVVFAGFEFPAGASAWAVAEGAAGCGGLVGPGGGYGICAASFDVELGGMGFDPARKIPIRPPDTARAGAACVAAVVAGPGERTSVIRLFSVDSL